MRPLDILVPLAWLVAVYQLWHDNLDVFGVILLVCFPIWLAVRLYLHWGKNLW